MTSEVEEEKMKFPSQSTGSDESSLTLEVTYNISSTQATNKILNAEYIE